MCRALYIASYKPLPFVEWNEACPGFWVGELQTDDEHVRKQFSVPFVVYAGSFEGCSCGFVYDEEPVEDDEYESKRDAQARESVSKLRDYICIARNDGVVELFFCWEGDQGKEPDQRLEVDLDFFEQTEFGVEGTKFLRIVNRLTDAQRHNHRRT